MDDQTTSSAGSEATVNPAETHRDGAAKATNGSTGIRSATPQNGGGTIDPEAPGNTGTTPGTTSRE